jgi:hypothetical protein
MKLNPRLGIAFVITALLVFALAFGSFNQPATSGAGVHAASAQAQVTATPLTDQTSEIGSTDGILLMGIVITLIVTLPLISPKEKTIKR